MGVRARRPNSPESNGLSPPSSGGKNANGNMSGVEMRRKAAHPDVDNVAANFISRESFSLDEPVPRTPTGSSHGFFDLPLQDQRNFLLLVLLYFLQGIPMGLAMGSVPFLLKNHMSYGEIGTFSLASYPYSLKLFWSPFVDAVWSPKIGRRKTWIVPIQFLSGFGMLWLGSHVEEMMLTTGKAGGPTVWGFMTWWFFLVLMCATQDIAVDGWALTLLTPANVSFASTAQTVGLTAGHFMSYTVFLALNAKDFANKWIRTVPSEEGLVSLGGYLTFWGWAYIVVTIGLGLMKREERSENEDGVWDVYKIMWGILKLKNVQTIIIVHLIAKIGFQANDGVTNLKLLDKGFGKDNMALTVLIDFPFEIGLGYYAGMWSQRYTPMRLWCWGFVGRLGAAMLAQLTVAVFPSSGVTLGYLLLVIGEHVLSTFTNTVMFVAVSAFHAKVSDPVIGGTYMTLLATVSNLGGTFPRYFVLKLVDTLTVATCHPSSSASPSGLKGALVTEAFSCAMQADKERCESGGGTCETVRDGYYAVNMMCVAFGTATFLWYIRPKVLHLQSLPLRAWRLSPGK
ncbi:acetyl-coenzyme A transporter 1 domain-containing protein [Hirsutella rhossiliensis]|uniref:Acetyl-coenzyme A transporter 1 domain-containing protein n=1 Tax=Hirsutella rhossiliensis TaxID=111463 RepID=A0A9P8N401_9HYPO|nr:acetyl-coenzyme A transporter 1 domain-containing protein [Hirsutella rhossiliensis]KAH0964272.1 acetyl-coenzyme A transporter 1 domain-containing protein [Hirsutella rhossiliensis]